MATTPTGAQRNVSGAPDTTKPAKLATATPRTPTHKVTGPSSMPVTGRALATQSGPPPLHRASADSAEPSQQR